MDAVAKPHSIDEVKAMLDKAKYGGEPIVFLHPTDQLIYDAVSQVAVDAFRKIGLNVDDQVMDRGTILQRRNSNEPLDNGRRLQRLDRRSHGRGAQALRSGFKRRLSTPLPPYPLVNTSPFRMAFERQRNIERVRACVLGCRENLVALGGQGRVGYVWLKVQ